MDAARDLLRARRAAERQPGSRGRRAAHLRAGQAARSSGPSPRTAPVADEFIVSHGAADRRRPRHGLRADRAATSRSCLDLFPRDRESGCFADMTRTFVVGEPSDEMRRVPHALPRGARPLAGRGQAGRARAATLHRARLRPLPRGRLPDAAARRQPGEVLEDGFFHGARARGRPRGARGAVPRTRGRRAGRRRRDHGRAGPLPPRLRRRAGSRTSCSSPRTAARS